MEEAIAKADVLIEALGWIRQFRDKITVIKLGGSVMEDAERAAAPAARHRLHGDGRHAAGRRPRRRRGDQPGDGPRPGSKPRFIQGRRYTDDATLATSSSGCWPTRSTSTWPRGSRNSAAGRRR